MTAKQILNDLQEKYADKQEIKYLREDSVNTLRNLVRDLDETISVFENRHVEINRDEYSIELVTSSTRL